MSTIPKDGALSTGPSRVNDYDSIAEAYAAENEDGYTGALYLDKPSEVARYTTAWTDMWNASLSEGPSRDLINLASRELSP